jgi:hypothetical protein
MTIPRQHLKVGAGACHDIRNQDLMGSAESQQTFAALIRSAFKAHDDWPCFQLLELRKKMRQKHGNLLINITS